MTTVCYNINDPEALLREIERLRAVHEDQRARWEVERRALQKQIPPPRLPRASERIDEYRIKQMRGEIEKAYRRLHGLQDRCKRLAEEWREDAQCTSDLRAARAKQECAQSLLDCSQELP